MPFDPSLDPLAAEHPKPSPAPGLSADRPPSLQELADRAGRSAASPCPRCGCRHRIPDRGGWVCRHCRARL